MAIVQSGEPPGGHTPAEALKGAEHHVLFVGHAAVLVAQLPAGQLQELLAIAIPEPLGRRLVALGKFPDPLGDVVVHHGRPFPFRPRIPGLPPRL